MASIRVHDVGLGEAAAEVPFGGGVGEPLGVQGVEVNLVVASELEVFDAFAAGEEVEGDVQDVVGFVIGEMPLEEVEVVVDVADQAGSAGQQEHGADAAGGEALDAIGEFVVDVAGGDHGLFAFWPGPVLDAVEDSLPAFTESSAVAFSCCLRLRLRVFLGIVAVTRKPPKVGIVRKCFHLYYSKFSGGFRAFSPIAKRFRYKLRLVEG